MLLTAVVFFLVLSILVFVHELGHFWVAKKLGILVEEFGFGLPPRIWGKRIGETIYSINALPIGGFVRLYGEERPSEPSTTENRKLKIQNSKLKSRAFYARPAWQRGAVLTAGVAMNFLLALVVLSYLFTQGVFVPAKRVHIEKVDEGSPAQEAGLKKNDIIVSLNGEKIETSDQLVSITKQHLGEEVTVEILRGLNFDEAVTETGCPNCQQLTFSLIPRKNPPEGQGAMGITISNYEQRVYAWYQAPTQGLRESLILSWELIRGIGRTLWKLINFQSVSQEVAGPVGIYQVTGEAVKFGRLAILELLGLLSLNLAIINILPFPALDGGRLLFVIIESVFGRKIKLHWENAVHQIGMAILLFLIILITINDVLRILGGG